MNDTNTQKAPRWMKILLLLSLAANVGVVGVIGGAMLRTPAGAHTPTPEGVSVLARAMPMKFQRELRKALRERREELRPNRQELFALRDRLAAALLADPFEIEAVNTVLHDQRTMLTGITIAGHEEVIRQIEAMGPRDRARYVERLYGGSRTERAAENRP